MPWSMSSPRLPGSPTTTWSRAHGPATLSVWVQQMRRVGVRPRIGMLRRAWRLGLDLFVDTARLSAALFRHLVLRRPVRGRLRAARYGATAASPQAAGRRALSEWLG